MTSLTPGALVPALHNCPRCEDPLGKGRVIQRSPLGRARILYRCPCGYWMEVFSNDQQWPCHLLCRQISRTSWENLNRRDLAKGLRRRGWRTLLDSDLSRRK